MGKLFKFLKPYAAAVAAIICILVVQAYCDLSLPTYTSDIVNVGIQQGGIDEALPDTISKKDLNHLLLLVPSDRQKIVKNAYTESVEKYDYNGTVMELKASVKEDKKKVDRLSEILGIMDHSLTCQYFVYTACRYSCSWQHNRDHTDH